MRFEQKRKLWGEKEMEKSKRSFFFRVRIVFVCVQSVRPRYEIRIEMMHVITTTVILHVLVVARIQ